MTTLCATCAHSIFCETWGEWKCKKRTKTKYENVLTCPDYTKHTTEKSACRCETCEDRPKDE